MAVNIEAYQSIKQELDAKQVTLVAVSKIQPVESIQKLYELGQRDFGENYVQELVDKQGRLPKDIRWHYIGHLQSNKVKYIAPFVHLIHGVDSLKLLKEINKEAAKNNRVIDVLLQLHITHEETKFGMDGNDVAEIIDVIQNKPEQITNINIRGMMGMATFTDDVQRIEEDFNFLVHMARQTYEELPPEFKALFSIMSFGMSSDYKIAIAKGSTMVRIGSLLFGARISVK